MSRVTAVTESRIARKFQALREDGEKALIAYVTAGDPDLSSTRDFVLGLADAGADIIELGIPFSDPLLDGPVIQAASQRALDRGTRVSQIFEMVRSLRVETDVPLLFMTCLNPIFQRGSHEFALECKESGVDGVLITDLPPEEGREWIETAIRFGLDRIFMLAPASSPDRVKSVAAAASGFIYCQSRAGVTGERKTAPPDLSDLIHRVRDQSDLPIAVGFGISTPDQVRAVTDVAEGAIVGSAFVRLIGSAGSDGVGARSAIMSLAADLKAGTRRSEPRGHAGIL